MVRFDVEQNTLGGDFGEKASNSDDSSYKAYESDASYSNSFKSDRDKGLKDDFDSNSDEDLNNDLDFDKDKNENYHLSNPQDDMRNPILIKGLVFPGLDGYWLKGYYGGHLLITIGVDANDCIYPMAFTAVESEKKNHGFGSLSYYIGAWRSTTLIIYASSLTNESMWPVYVGNEKYEVNYGLGNKHVVDFLNSSYSCRKWYLIGIPCLMQWEHVRDMKLILPPMIRRPPGRPKQTKRKEVDEARKMDQN
ncbi:hypothetical protein PVK06_019486 [Gossypium arboreum]|uniref:Uncharacterized protein n=1 Tax=Gossypium arboreum TaxID=29729 RepID=A0ABR0PJV6_GOSAR|nr:hypothetical protein PVK06_019486 [Gossypium arboreum]